jgi:hypothetical protein
MMCRSGRKSCKRRLSGVRGRDGMFGGGDGSEDLSGGPLRAVNFNDRLAHLTGLDLPHLITSGRCTSKP